MTMKSDSAVLLGFSILCMTSSAVLLLAIEAWDADIKDHQRLAIEHGCAEYNSTTGEFEWSVE